MEPNNRPRLVTPVRRPSQAENLRRPSQAENLSVVVTFAGTVTMKCVVNHRSSYNFIKRDALQSLEKSLGQKFPKHIEIRSSSNGKPVWYKKVALDIKLHGNIRISQVSFVIKETLNGVDAILGTNLLDNFLREISIHPDGSHESGRAN